MSFRFNFAGDNKPVFVPSIDEIQWLDSQEVIPDSQIKELDNMVGQARMFTCGEVEIGHVVVSDAISNMTTMNTPDIASKLAEEASSDLITGKYEGGLKIWECTHDLVKYLIKHENNIEFQGKQVLDLGCGAGILGIYAFLKGASVTFQDYNIEVLQYVTIPNILLNIEEEEREERLKKCTFFSGDWASFNRKLDSNVVYDIILTSETIYNEMNYDKLLKLFSQRLTNDGSIYVAAKTCYFGVGGGIRQFEKAIIESNLFHCEISWKNMSGIQREILKIMKKL